MAVGVGIALFILGVSPGCQHTMPDEPPLAPRRDINAVLADHARKLMAIPGVVGVYIGLLDDDQTPCLKVMIERKDAQLKRAIPRSLEGYPVVTEVSGTIRPLTNPAPSAPARRTTS